MQVISKKYCRFDFVRYITEKQLNNPNGNVTISITEKNNKEQMIFSWEILILLNMKF